MSADNEFEGRFRAQLKSALGRVDGPHPSWESAPAATIVAGDPVRRSRRAPWRLLAVAAVLTIGGAAALILASPDRDTQGVAGCPTLEDYAAASAAPSPDPEHAPDVSFPPVADDATATSGTLELGAWAVLADEDGPTFQIRVRDFRDCGRLPDLRSSYPGGTIVLVTIDVRAMRSRLGPWLGGDGNFDIGFDGQPSGGQASVTVFGVPGVVRYTRLTVPATFAHSSDVVFDLRPTTAALSLHAVDALDGSPVVPGVAWLLRPGTVDVRPTLEPLAVGATTTAGEVQLGEVATVRVGVVTAVMRVVGTEEVPGYPAVMPADGMVFIEAHIEALGWDGDDDPNAPSATAPEGRWIATTAAGRELALLGDRTFPDERGLLWPMVGSGGGSFGWLVVEAPRSGPVRLGWRAAGATEDTFWVMLRP
jgi:hypothetical protein